MFCRTVEGRVFVNILLTIFVESKKPIFVDGVGDSAEIYPTKLFIQTR